MTDLLTRIQEVISWSTLGPTAFADEIGVARPVISHILSARNKASLEVVQKMLSRFPEIAPIWLLSGEGEMLSGVDISGVDTSGRVTSRNEPPMPRYRNEVASAFSQEIGKGQRKEKSSPAATDVKEEAAKKLVKVMLFYSDGSFESYNPS